MLNMHPELWAQGCAMCRAALENSPDGQTIGASLANGILLMLVLPYGLLMIFGFIIYRAWKKSKESHPHHTGPYAS